MSRLDELIQEYCPNGVEYKKLGTAISIERGKRLVREQLSNECGYPVYQNSMTPLGYHTDYNYPENTAFIIGAGAAGEIGFSSVKFWAADDCYPMVCREDISSRYLYHALLRIQPQIKSRVRKASIPRLSRASIEQLEIPVPPLPVQSEIVRILDNFTELTAELTARKKQYEFYRDKLLTPDITIKHVRLGDICSVITKGTTPKSYAKTGISFVKTEAFEGTRIVPEKLSYVDEEIHTTFLRRSILEENDILVTIAGATIGKCAMVPKEILPANTNQALAIIRLAKGNSPKYVMYLLQSNLMKQYMQKNIKGSAQPNLNLKQLNDFIIPLPPLSVQNRLVQVLDNFYAICSDLKIGLPAEIEARQKQYEFYRDALLNYAATGKIIAQTDR